jgi:acetylornithine deacetylase
MLAGLRLARPIHLAFSYDEEIGCRGVPHLIARLPELCARPLGVIVGEPSGMRAVRGHKGKAAAHVIIKGRSGHSSRPELGLNAIHAMADVLSTAVSEAGQRNAGSGGARHTGHRPGRPAHTSEEAGRGPRHQGL